MKKATIADVEKEKKDWYHDPCYDLVEVIDLSENIDYSEYRQEFIDYQKKCETNWSKEEQKKEDSVAKEAERLGLSGLYKLIKQNELLLERQNKAITHLVENEPLVALKALRGSED